jgi:hypothetical protein
MSDKDLTPEFDILAVTPEYEVYDDDSFQLVFISDVDTVIYMNGPEGYDAYITAQVL